MAPKPEPKISQAEAVKLASQLNPSQVSIEVSRAILLQQPEWHLAKRIWYWADSAGAILVSVNENKIVDLGDASLKMPAETEQKTMGMAPLITEDKETGHLKVEDHGIPAPASEADAKAEEEQD